jgi:hypothetical protein
MTRQLTQETDMQKAIVNAGMIAALAGAVFGMPSLSLAAGSCSARMQMVKQTWGKMPDSPKKAEIAAYYNDANHARKAHDEQGCLTSINKAEAAMKSGQ